VITNRRRRVLVVAVGVAVTACTSDVHDRAGTPVETTTATTVGSPNERGGPVDLGAGRTIHLQCAGSGQPTVVLVSGLGDGADVWSVPPDPDPQGPTVLAGVAAFSRVCAYDRPNTGPGRSTAVPQPTSAADAADDLAELLMLSDEPGPFVLVGHSYGGPIIRVYASTHPDEVAGLVLVDGLSENLADGLTPAQQAVFEALNTPPVGGDAEVLDLQGTFQQLVPTIVLTADRPQLTPDVVASGQLPAEVDQEFADALWAAQLVAQDELAAMFPGAEHVTSTDSDHYIHTENPQLVIDSIREVVDTVRGSQPDG
jgi:pimeloyl-ACP methyl ester carboxylesterase